MRFKTWMRGEETLRIVPRQRLLNGRGDGGSCGGSASLMPFVTTKGDTGTGLGMWVTRGIVERHQDRTRLRSSTGSRRHGTVISVLLPHGRTQLRFRRDDNTVSLAVPDRPARLLNLYNLAVETDIPLVDMRLRSVYEAIV